MLLLPVPVIALVKQVYTAEVVRVVVAALLFLFIAGCASCVFNTSPPHLTDRRDGQRLLTPVTFPDLGPLEPGSSPKSDQAGRDRARPDSGADTKLWPDGRAPCGPANCSSGCCKGNLCQSPATNSFCGLAGASCQDCAASGTICSSAGSCVGCTNSNECSGDTLCLSSSCLPAYGRQYRITIYSAKVLATRPDGTRFDEYSDPDPQAYLTIAGQGTWQTSMRSDTLNPVWDEYVDKRTLQKNTQLEVAVFDSDYYGTSPLMGKVTISPGVPLSALRAGVYVFNATDIKAPVQELTLKFTPQ